MTRVKINEEALALTILSPQERSAEFAPWQRDERGQQVFVKLKRGEEVGLLATGEHCVLDAELQQCLMRLVNEGWTVQGELTVSFEGQNETGIDPYVFKDPIALELGQALLSLVDPQCNGPLLAALPAIRDEIARESGLIPPGINIKDNLNLEPTRYRILLKNTPYAEGELFLNRYLAVGSFDQLSGLEGWTTVEPAFKMQAKWITPENREKAESLNCMVFGPMQVLMTHLKKSIITAAPELLGLQDTFSLVSRLQFTHPIVVEDFLNSRENLRHLRHILQALLRENVSVSDLVTILETVGDNLKDIAYTGEIVEKCRLALSKQICWSLLSPEGELHAISLSANLEQALDEGSPNKGMELSEELANSIVQSIKRKVAACSFPPVLFTDPPHRCLVSELLRDSCPTITVLSTAEIAKDTHVVLSGLVDFPKDSDNPDGFGPAPSLDNRAQASPVATEQAPPEQQAAPQDVVELSSAGASEPKDKKKAKKEKKKEEAQDDKDSKSKSEKKSKDKELGGVFGFFKAAKSRQEKENGKDKD